MTRTIRPITMFCLIMNLFLFSRIKRGMCSSETMTTQLIKPMKQTNTHQISAPSLRTVEKSLGTILNSVDTSLGTATKGGRRFFLPYAPTGTPRRPPGGTPRVVLIGSTPATRPGILRNSSNTPHNNIPTYHKQSPTRALFTHDFSPGFLELGRITRKRTTIADVDSFVTQKENRHRIVRKGKRRTTTLRTQPYRLSFADDCLYRMYYCMRSFTTGHVCARTMFLHYHEFESYCHMDFMNCKQQYIMWELINMGHCMEIKQLATFHTYDFTDDSWLYSYFVFDVGFRRRNNDDIDTMET